MNHRDEFELWFKRRFPRLCAHEINQLRKDRNGFYKDRGTLGMWIAWQYKQQEIDKLKKKLSSINANT